MSAAAGGSIMHRSNLSLLFCFESLAPMLWRTQRRKKGRTRNWVHLNRCNLSQKLWVSWRPLEWIGFFPSHIKSPTEPEYATTGRVWFRVYAILNCFRRTLWHPYFMPAFIWRDWLTFLAGKETQLFFICTKCRLNGDHMKDRQKPTKKLED